MSGRPQSLFPLFSAVTALDGVGPKIAQNLMQISIEKPRDLLFLMPYSGIDRRKRDTVQSVDLPNVLTVEVLIGAHRAPRVRRGAYRVSVEDSNAAFELVFFHARADYLKKVLPIGERRIVSGKVEFFDGVAQMVHPDYILKLDDAGELPEFEPIYPLTAGVTQKIMTKAIQSALLRVPKLAEWIDPAQKERSRWPDWLAALQDSHSPASLDDINISSPARERLAYDEFFAHQLTLALARSKLKKARGTISQASGGLQRKVRTALPYVPTAAQERAVKVITADMGRPMRMNRLLQGDVGAGKTLVAFMALLVAVEAGGQGVMMAPTEILARQHMAGLRPLAESAGVVLDILTGRDRGPGRQIKIAALAKGEIDILVGTHAVFQPDVQFDDLRLAVVDEQHRFGVRQRFELGKKGDGVDVLVMTATPIPRSLALAQFGDMDVSLLDEKPPGRQPIATALVSTGRMEEVIQHLRQAVSEGKQCYWVCPLVEDSETVDLTSVEERFKHLRAVLGEGILGLVHGQMPAVEKDAAMTAFESGQTRVLVATTVIEVGVDVPNATIMVIERAETFGLAQLHQLRGRVGRGSQASTCLLIYQAPLSDAGEKRLTVLRESEDGFQIAETDLKMRGAGDVIGTVQSGVPRFRIADIESQSALLAIAQSDARKLLNDDPNLTSQRGKAARVLLWLMEQDRAIRLISVG